MGRYRVLAILQEAGRPLSALDIAAAMRRPPQHIASYISRLRAYGDIEIDHYDEHAGKPRRFYRPKQKAIA